MPPDGVEQLIAAEHDPRPAHEELEKTELGGRERNRLAAHPHRETAAIHLEPAGLEHAGRPGLSPELDLDARDQLPDKERLDDVIVRAELEADDPVRLRGARGQKKDRDVADIRIGPNPLADLQPVGIRQHDVQDDQIGSFSAAELDGPLAGLETDQRESFLLEVVLQEGEQVRIIFDEDNLLHCVHSPMKVIAALLQFGDRPVIIR